MSLTFILIMLIVLGFVATTVFKVFPIFETQKGSFKINFKPIGAFIALLLISILQPYNYEVINVGHKGLLINLLGDKRGASNTQEVSGVIFYNKYTQEIQEIPLDQRHIEYPESIIVAKGGFPCPIKPSFNYSVKQATASDMFTNLRSTYKAGGLQGIQDGWLNNAIIGAINDVANRHSIDYLFNNREAYESEILAEVNKRIGKWFIVSQLKTNIQPPKAIRQSIEDKATADADAIKAEAQARVAQADAQRKIQIAKGDSAATVIEAASVAEAMRLKKAELTPIYVEYIKWMDADPKLPRVPVTVLGSNTSTLLNIK